MPELKTTDLYVTETVLDTAAEQSLELDFLLPDYEPEVFRVLKTRVSPRRPAGPGQRRTAGDQRQLHRFGPLSRGGHPHPPRGAAERPLFQVARPAGGGNHRPVCPPLLPCKRPGGERPAAGGPLRVEPSGCGPCGQVPHPVLTDAAGGRGTAPPERGHLLRQAGPRPRKTAP